MPNKIFSWVGIPNDKLALEHRLEKGGIEKAYNVNYNKNLIVNMDFKGKQAHENNSRKVNAQGWERNSNKYWKQILKEHPEYFSEDNKNRIKQYRIPKIDETFINHFPEYKDFEKERLFHHHIGEDGQAVAVPESIHSGYGGVHNVEKEIGVTDNAKANSQKCQEAFDKGQIVNWDTFEEIQGNTNNKRHSESEQLTQPVKTNEQQQSGSEQLTQPVKANEQQQSGSEQLTQSVKANEQQQSGSEQLAQPVKANEQQQSGSEQFTQPVKANEQQQSGNEQLTQPVKANEQQQSGNKQLAKANEQQKSGNDYDYYYGYGY